MACEYGPIAFGADVLNITSMFYLFYFQLKGTDTQMTNICVISLYEHNIVYFYKQNGQMMHALDEYDKKLLKLLQQNNRLTTEELSIKVSLSQSAVQRRVTKLRNEKIIEADVSIISASAIGLTITCIVDVVLHEGTSKAIEKFKQAMRNCIEVTHCYYVTGSYDFVLIVNAKDMSHYEEFSKKHLMDNQNLKHFYTHVVMDKVKVGHSVSF